MSTPTPFRPGRSVVEPRRVPKYLRRVSPAARVLHRGYRRTTASTRKLPDFLIIGAQKAGTTSLFDYVMQHPAVASPVTKEVHFFDRHYHWGRTWYCSHFPYRWGLHPVTGEATPAYMLLPEVPPRVRSMLPHVRLVVILRDPTLRAWSHYQHEVAKGRESRSFEQAIEDERDHGDDLASRPEFVTTGSYLARGRYAEQIERWTVLFPTVQLLVIELERLVEQPKDVLAQVFHHLQLPTFPEVRYVVRNRRPHPPLAPGLHRDLADYFRVHDDRLQALLGRSLAWQ